MRPRGADQVEHGGLRGQTGQVGGQLVEHREACAGRWLRLRPEALVAGEPVALGQQLVGPAGIEPTDASISTTTSAPSTASSMERLASMLHPRRLATRCWP